MSSGCSFFSSFIASQNLQAVLRCFPSVPGRVVDSYPIIIFPNQLLFEGMHEGMTEPTVRHYLHGSGTSFRELAFGQLGAHALDLREVLQAGFQNIDEEQRKAAASKVLNEPKRDPKAAKAQRNLKRMNAAENEVERKAALAKERKDRLKEVTAKRMRNI